MTFYNQHLLGLTLFFIIILSDSIAQKSYSEFGFKAGLNIRDLGGNKAGLYAVPGYHIGIYNEYAISTYTSIQPELIFSLQGAAVDPNRDIKLNYHYLNLPIIGKYYFFEDFNIEAGPQIGYMVSAYERDDFGSYKINDQVRRFDFSVAFGVAYKYQDRFGLTLRYTLGVTDTIYQGVIFNRRLSNRVYQAMLSYLL